jgi:hypothetical protein
MIRMCVCMHSRFIENHPIQILEDGPLISEVVLSQLLTLVSLGLEEFLTSLVSISESEVGLNLLLSIATLGRWQAGLVAVAMVER